MQGKFINLKSYDFNDNNGKRIQGQYMNCLVDDEICKVNLTDEEFDIVSDDMPSFGDEIALDVRVKGKYANYILAH